jgi:transcriptional regulator with XRE-family HTH domain
MNWPNEPRGPINGAKIKARRTALGWSKGRLAKAVGSHAQTIDKIERGEIKHSRYYRLIREALEKPVAAAHTAASNTFRITAAQTAESEINSLVKLLNKKQFERAVLNQQIADKKVARACSIRGS